MLKSERARVGHALHQEVPRGTPRMVQSER
jgi:hypothetical protein